MFFLLRSLMIAAVLMAIGIAIGGHYHKKEVLMPPLVHDHAGPTLQQIQALSQLVTLQIDVADVQVTRLDGRLGGLSVALIVRAQVQIATDLGQARLEKVDQVHRTATLFLPLPVPMLPRIDHQATHIFGFNARGLWQINPQAEVYVKIINSAYGEAERTIAHAAQSDQLRAKAQDQAQTVLKAFFRSLDWEVQVCWLEQGGEVSTSDGASQQAAPHLTHAVQHQK